MPSFPDPWPLAALVLRTPRLELRPDDDTGLLELVEVVHGGVHPPEEMPFSEPWTDADPRYIGRASLQYFWGRRAALTPEDWSLNFLVRRRSDGRVIGVQGLNGVQFGVTWQVSSGSWLGMPYQGRGLGTEMRAAVLGLAFDHLDALSARSEAFVDNPASYAVSHRLGYREDGSDMRARRGRPARMVRLLLERSRWSEHCPGWTLEVSGLTEDCRDLLGAG